MWPTNFASTDSAFSATADDRWGVRPSAASGLIIARLRDSLMETVASNPLGPVWKDRLGLSARVAPEFCGRPGHVGNVPHADESRTTLDDLGGSVVFRVQDVPTVVVLSADYPFRRDGGAG